MGPFCSVVLAALRDKGHKSKTPDSSVINELSIMTLENEAGVRKPAASAINAKVESRHHTMAMPTGSRVDPSIGPKTTL